ncbi:alpha/beta hydrolase [Thioalkalivibrio sp. XN279]|uniref:alpha/beta hydrolase n=1 Tax=Thioalkalivibrio sp. XN279 TaxID=2714953 RepID=UPI0014076369|nr:alpha/beta hydrolase [Thioalkalivibrio sp. XN279]NHA14036.1 alpha/beta hydrolase [Thioalkalivibrio sp. XN279]
MPLAPRRTEPRAVARAALLLVAAVLLAGCRPTAAINAFSPSDHYVKEPDQAYGEDPRQQLDLYRPTTVADEAPVVVFFYGNGWREAARADFEFVASALASDGIIVLIPDYRAHPQVTFPAFVEDGAAVVRWAMDNVDGVADGARPLYLMGHSAGAQIAALLALDPRYLAAVTGTPPPLAGFIGLSGPYDFLPLEEGYMQTVFPEDTRPQSQPINFVSADAPPTLLVHGTDDTRVLPEHSRRLAQQLEEHGVPVTLRMYDGTGHVRVVAALAPPLQFIDDTMEDVIAFIRAR